MLRNFLQICTEFYHKFIVLHLQWILETKILTRSAKDWLAYQPPGTHLMSYLFWPIMDFMRYCWVGFDYYWFSPTKSIKSQNTKSNKNPRTYFGVRIWWTSCSTYKFFIDSRFRPWNLRPGPQSLVWFDLFIFKVHRLSWMCCRPEQKKIIIICFVVIDGYKKCYLIFPIY